MAVTINIPSQVKTYANLAAFPASGSLKTIYIAEDTNKTYRWDGSTYVEISASASGLTVGTTPIASGTIGRVLFQGTGNVLQQSSSLFWDSTNNRLGIGTSTPAEALDVVGILKGTTSAAGSMFSLAGVNNTSLSVANDSSGRAFIEVKGNTAATIAAGAYFSADGYQESWFNVTARQAATDNKRWRFGNLGSNNYFAIQKLNDAGTAILSTALTAFSSTSNIGINTTTDAGFRLDVNGTARVQGQLTATSVNSSSVGNVVANQLMQPQGYSGEFRFTNGSGAGWFYTWVQNNGVERMRLSINNNLLINTTTDAGFKLDVNGTARVKGTGTTIGTTSFTVQDSASSDLFRVYDNGLVAIKAGVISLNGSNGSISGGFIASTGQIISGGTSITASAQMEVISTTRGFLPPRMTTTQKNAIASPATGLQVYDTTLNQMSYYNGTTWTNI